jgi:hypothetical protein
VSDQESFAQLPKRVTLDLSEIAILLGALDRAADRLDPDSEDYRAVRTATRLLTGKVWPELGELLGENEQ